MNPRVSNCLHRLTSAWDRLVLMNATHTRISNTSFHRVASAGV